MHSITILFAVTEEQLSLYSYQHWFFTLKRVSFGVWLVQLRKAITTTLSTLDPEKFAWNKFTLKTYQMFSNHTTPEELKTQQSAVILDSVGGTLGQRNHMIVMYLIVFEKLRFRDGLVWRVDLTVEIKLRFKIASRKLWMRPKKGDSCSRKLYLATFESKPCANRVVFQFQWILWKGAISRGLGFQGLKVDYSMFLVKFFNLQTIQWTIKRNVKFLIFSELLYSGNEKQEQMSRILLFRVKLKQLTGDCII